MLELSITQTLGRRLIGALIGSYQHAGGFQSNPYRRVILLHGDFQPQESHPSLRDRFSVTGRLRYALGQDGSRREALRRVGDKVGRV